MAELGEHSRHSVVVAGDAAPYLEAPAVELAHHDGCRGPKEAGLRPAVFIPQHEKKTFIHNTPTRTNQTHTKREGRTPRTRHSRFILMLATCNVYRAHRHGSESPYPGSTPGLNPCNHLAWRACGPWRTHRHNTYDHVAWLASEERDHLHLRRTWNDMVWHGMT